MRPKEKGTRFEYRIKYELEKYGFYVQRAYSSMGIADMVASPPVNRKGNNRTLLIQAKNTKKKDYVARPERERMTKLDKQNSGVMLLVYNDNHKMMVKVWSSGRKCRFDDFIKNRFGLDQPSLTL